MLPDHNCYMYRDRHSWTDIPAPLQNVLKKWWCSDDKHCIRHESCFLFV